MLNRGLELDPDTEKQGLKCKTIPRRPMEITCNNCGSDVKTVVKKRIGSMNWTFSLLCFLFGCVGGCCLIPLCMDSLKEMKHSCPICNKVHGSEN